MSTFASPPRSLPRKRTPNFGEREYSARFIAAGPVPAHRPTMGAAGTMLSDRRMERSVGNEDGAVQDHGGRQAHGRRRDCR